MSQPKFSVSLMCMDLAVAGSQVAALSKHADAFHLDIMDGHFAPNLALSPDWVKSVAPFSSVTMEAHLMTDEPGRWVEPLAKAGAHIISPHAETLNRDAFRVFGMISDLGKRIGLVLNPATPLSTVEPMLGRIDVLTIMTVDVGFAGQAFIPEMLDKIAEAKRFREREGLSFSIQIDGSCNVATFKRLREAGADILVLGTSGLFSLADDIDEAWRLMAEGYERETGEPVRSRHE